LFLGPFLCFSQQTAADTTKELNELNSVRPGLLQELTLSQASVNRLQAVVDSCSAKLTEDSTELAKIKASYPDGKQSLIRDHEKKIESLRTKINQLTPNLIRNKDQMEKASALLKEIDARIKALQTRPG
jgi:chromosome segregation ATPase